MANAERGVFHRATISILFFGGMEGIKGGKRKRRKMGIKLTKFHRARII